MREWWDYNAMRWRFFYGAFAGVLLLVVGAIVLPAWWSSAPTTDTVLGDREYWHERIDDRGAYVAYQEFVKANSTYPEGVQHVRAHMIGEVLYATVGIRGISVCDASFGFGCFHGLFTRGFAAHGETFVTEADKMCVNRFGVLGTGCQHGIGHGIVEYVGHSDIDRALALCSLTTQPAQLLGCPSGVFMERHTPFTVIPGEAPLPPLAFSEDDPYGLCNDVPDMYRPVCYFELGGWWEIVLDGDVLRMGALCEQIDTPFLRTPCFMGIGKIIGHTRAYDSERSFGACTRATEAYRGECMAGVAWSMYSNPAYNARATATCELLSGLEETICKRYTNVVEYEDISQ